MVKFLKHKLNDKITFANNLKSLVIRNMEREKANTQDEGRLHFPVKFISILERKGASLEILKSDKKLAKCDRVKITAFKQVPIHNIDLHIALRRYLDPILENTKDLGLSEERIRQYKEFIEIQDRWDQNKLMRLKLIKQIEMRNEIKL